MENDTLKRMQERFAVVEDNLLLGKQITGFINCGECTDEQQMREGGEFCVENLPPPTLIIGITEYGLQVWCVKHDKNVAHFRLKGEAEVDYRSEGEGFSFTAMGFSLGGLKN